MYDCVRRIVLRLLVWIKSFANASFWSNRSRPKSNFLRFLYLCYGVRPVVPRCFIWIKSFANGSFWSNRSRLKFKNLMRFVYTLVWWCVTNHSQMLHFHQVTHQPKCQTHRIMSVWWCDTNRSRTKWKILCDYIICVMMRCKWFASENRSRMKCYKIWSLYLWNRARWIVCRSIILKNYFQMIHFDEIVGDRKAKIWCKFCVSRANSETA